MEELTMKTVFAAATGLALVATGALANPTTGPRTGEVFLRATVNEFIGIVSTRNSTIGDLDLMDGTSGSGANNNVNLSVGEEKAEFVVMANTRYDINLDWDTWSENGLTNPTTTYDQAYYYNADVDATCAIGGSIHFDEAPNTDGAVSQPSGGASDWTLTDFRPGRRTYGIGSNLDPQHTDCDGGVAAEGTYELRVAITLSKHN
jgi:hypothetical protein